MATLQDYLASLPPEEQRAFFERLRSQLLAEDQDKRLGPVLGSLARLGAGTYQGLGNALYGMATLPLAATNAVGLTDIEAARRPLLGPGGYYDTVGPYTGNAYNLGQLLGFLGSMAVPTGAGKLVGKGGSLLARTVRGAAHLGLETAARTPGELGERGMAGLHALPAGAVFGAAGRARGFIDEAGFPVVGLAAERLVSRAGGVEQAAAKGLVKGLEPMGRYIFRSGLRGSVAGAALSPLGGSPIDVTGSPFVDSVAFNSLFFAASAAYHRPKPAVRGKTTAERTATNVASDITEIPPAQPTPPPDKFEAPFGRPMPMPPEKPTEPAQRPLFSEETTPLIPTEHPAYDNVEPGKLIPRKDTYVTESARLAGAGQEKPYEAMSIDDALGNSETPRGRSYLAKIALDDLNRLGRQMFPAGRLRRLYVGYNAHPTDVSLASMDIDRGILVVPARYFTKPPVARLLSLVHEVAHLGSMGRALKQFEPKIIAQLYTKMGIPAYWENDPRIHGNAYEGYLRRAAAEHFFPGHPNGWRYISRVKLANGEIYGPMEEVVFFMPTPSDLAAAQAAGARFGGLKFEYHKYANKNAEPPSDYGSPYGYTDPLEYVAMLAEEYAAIGRPELERRAPGVPAVLELVFNGARNTYLHGVSRIEATDPRQGSLFPLTEVLGPPPVEGTVGEMPPIEVRAYDMQNRKSFGMELDRARLDEVATRYKLDDEPPIDPAFREALFDMDKKGNAFYDKLTAVAKSALRNSIADDADGIVNEAIDRARAVAEANPTGSVGKEAWQTALTGFVEELAKKRNADLEATRRVQGRAGPIEITDEFLKTTVLADPRALAEFDRIFESAPVEPLDPVEVPSGVPMERAAEVLAEKTSANFLNVTETSKSRESSRLEGARSILGGGLEAFQSNRTISERTKAVILLRYGALFPANPTEPAGPKMSASGPFGVAEIARRTSLTTRQVRRILEELSVTSYIPEGYLFPPEGGTAPVPAEPVGGTHTVVPSGRLRPRTPGGLRAEGPREEKVYEDVVVPEKDTKGNITGFRVEKSLVETTRYGIRPGDTGNVVVPLETTYYDPVTGDKLGSTTGLFASAEAIDRRVRAEQQIGIQPPVPPPPAGDLGPQVVTLYRAEGVPDPAKPPPSWIQPDDLTGQGGWFYRDRALAESFLRDFVGPTGRITEIQVPIDVAESSLVQNLPEGHPAKRYSRRPHEEYFVESRAKNYAPAAPSSRAAQPAVATSIQQTAEEVVKSKTPEGRRAIAAAVGNEAQPKRREPKQLQLVKVGRFKEGSTLGEYQAYLEAVNMLGKPNMSRRAWQALRPEQRARHAVLRLGEAASQSELEYRRALRAYARRFADVNEQIPLLDQISNRSHVERTDLLFKEAKRLHADLRVVPSTPEIPSHFIITERDTGISYRAQDQGTAALLLNERARRLLRSPVLQPPGFQVAISLAGGPTSPAGPPEVPPGRGGPPDGELYGLPPRPENVLEALMGIAGQARWRPVRDYAANVTRVTSDQRIFNATDQAINLHERARQKAVEHILGLQQLAKRHKVHLGRRDKIVGEAAADLDAQAYEIQSKNGGNAADAWVRANEERIYREHGLSDNEVRFLKDSHKLWDKLFQDLGIGLEKYVYGYFSRMRRRTLQDTGQPLEGNPSFWALLERVGELPASDREFRYSVVFERYARQGFRHKFLMPEPGRPGPGPMEEIRAFLADYGVDPAAGIPPRWAEPFVELLRVLRGFPDERRQGAQIRTAGRLRQFRELAGSADKALGSMGLGERTVMRRALARIYSHFNEKMTDSELNTLTDYFLASSRSRTFGFNVMRATRHVTQSMFFTLPRVGPKAYFSALREMVDPAKFEEVYRRAVDAGAVKPSYYIEYLGERPNLLRMLDKTTFIYRFLDIWERVLSFRAQEIRSTDAMNAYRKAGASPGALKRYLVESGLNLLHPAFRGRVLQPLLRGNFEEAIQLHSRLLVDHAIFDYTIANTPYVFAGNWGRLFGQYGRWPLMAMETMWTLARYGGPERAKVLALYGASAAAVYGAGQALGVQTAQWIPFLHSVAYTGGPAISFYEDLRDVWSGDPQVQDRVVSDFKRNPVAFILGQGTRYVTPGWDVWRALAADMNLSARQRRLLSIPVTRGPEDTFKRLLGFKPVEIGKPKHQPLPERLLHGAVKSIERNF